MIWEVEIQPRGNDLESARVREEFALLTHSEKGACPVAHSARGFFLQGDLSPRQAEQLARDLLVDGLAEIGSVTELGKRQESRQNGSAYVTVLLKPGVMDPAAQSVLEAARGLGIPLVSVRTFRRYYLQTHEETFPPTHPALAKVLANDAIEQIVAGGVAAVHLEMGAAYRFQRVLVPIRELSDVALVKLSREGQLSLSLPEMQVIQAHFRSLGREPTDVELETIAQTWSEHCSHKTLKGKIEFEGRRFDNLLKETIFAATQEIRRRLGDDDWCVSVFEDNAGIVRFDDNYNVCFKVETHNHPSAIEPYGGANTGLGGVIRDTLGTGLGARPIGNTDVFCFAPPDTQSGDLPESVLHPLKVMKGVVAGVRDYGNRMGIPTVNGAVCFDERYLGNPLVFCGTVGLIPVECSHKKPEPGDLIVAIGGRTGRDGIHGATFSSLELSMTSEQSSGGAVQIGNAITEKKLLDVLLEARARALYHAITDCGAGGFSSAVGEMGEKIGAVVNLDQAPLKYEGLSYTEIWISEAQERMVLAVPPENWPALHLLCAGEDVEATVIGRFEPTGRIQLFYMGEQVADLEMRFLHDGRPPVVRQAIWSGERSGLRGQNQGDFGLRTSIFKSPGPNAEDRGSKVEGRDLTRFLLAILASPNVCSKEWIIRQYDHEVQGGTVIKPLVGLREDGPGDAAVLLPVLGQWTGLALGCGINPHYGDLDPYNMAAAVIDEAVRNVIAVGADPRRIALLDNFCWANTDRPEVLGSLVRAALACHDVALAYGTPFISGKDSLNNEFHARDRTILIPPTLLISALGRVDDVRRCVTMDLKAADNVLYLVGATRDELGGSHYNLVAGSSGGKVPRVDVERAPAIFRKLHEAIERGLVRSCHDLSEGGLAVAAAEMAFAGNVGADLALEGVESKEYGDEIPLFSESATRFLVEVAPADASELQERFGSLPLARIGRTCIERRLRIAGQNGEWIIQAPLHVLKEAWQKPMRW
jgi:phosphoribosylformylglycinamidine synthase